MTDECPKCHQVHGKCTGHNRAGKPCGLNPLEGQEVCHLHGGRAPQALAGARRRAVEAEARQVLAARWQNGAETAVADPLSELARLAGEAVAFKDYLRDQVTQLEGTLTYWQEKDYDTDPDGLGGWTKAAEEVRAVVAAYERALDRTAKILASIVKLDLAGRLLEVRGRQAEAIADAVRYGLAQVDMDAAIRRAAQEAIAEALAGLSTRPKELAS